MSTLPNNTEPQNVVSKKGKDLKNDDRPVSNSQEVPRECSSEEFNELLTQASTLTIDEAKSELLDCARYGEVDAVRAILDTFQQTKSSPLDGKCKFIDVTDKSGSTALHKSCANGHISTTKLLLHRGASHLSNLSGNTPLHWAAASGHENIVRLLLTEERFVDEMDVLRRNEFGRSALTEGFASQNTVLVGLLLEHDSAEEERLLGGTGTTTGGGDDDESKSIGEEGKDSDEGGHETERNAAAAADGIDSKVAPDLGDCASSVNTADTPRSSNSAKTCVVHEFDFQTVLNEQTDERRESLTRDGEEQHNSAPTPVTTDEVDDAVTESDQKEERRRTMKTLLIRELPIANADNPFGESAVDDTTGLGIWCASLVMARWMSSEDIVTRLNGKSVLELGAGCGVPGLAAALYSNAKSVYVTDLNPSTVRNLKHNIDLNRKRSSQSSFSNNAAVNTTKWDESRVSARTIDWDDETTWPQQQQQQQQHNDGGGFDFVIGSDLIYQSSIVPLLKKVVSGLLKKDSGTFLYVAPDDGREGLPEFIESMKKEEGNDDGFELVQVRVAPDSFCTNPLSSGDEDDCFLHFHELASTTYVLYEFRRRRRALL